MEIKKITDMNTSKDIDYRFEYERLKQLFIEKYCIGKRRTYGTEFNRGIYNYMSEYGFEDWALPGRSISFYDWTNTFKFPDEGRDCTAEKLLLYIQYVLNSIHRVKELVNKSTIYGYDRKVFDKILTNSNEILDLMNYMAVTDDKETYIVGKDRNTVTVAEIYPEIADKVYEYKRNDLKGNLERKEEILAVFAKRIEPHLDKLKEFEPAKQLEDDLRYLLNNFNIRHNNEEGKKQNSFYIDLTLNEIEIWYDRTYDMFLLSMMHLNYLEFKSNIKDAKKKKEK